MAPPREATATCDPLAGAPTNPLTEEAQAGIMPAETRKIRLPRQAEFMITVDRRLVLGNPLAEPAFHEIVINRQFANLRVQRFDVDRGRDRRDATAAMIARYVDARMHVRPGRGL